ncbi:MAG: hypothetical protein JWO98_86 [Frankiales bacterium]|nr:hypothetical protein [Frankiales bacterium]
MLCVTPAALPIVHGNWPPSWVSSAQEETRDGCSCWSTTERATWQTAMRPATWIYVLALAVGLIGIAVAVVARRRKPAPTTDANDTDAA